MRQKIVYVAAVAIGIVAGVVIGLHGEAQANGGLCMRGSRDIDRQALNDAAAIIAYGCALSNPHIEHGSYAADELIRKFRDKVEQESR